jgi:hypothetical protein
LTVSHSFSLSHSLYSSSFLSLIFCVRLPKIEMLKGGGIQRKKNHDYTQFHNFGFFPSMCLESRARN